MTIQVYAARLWRNWQSCTKACATCLHSGALYLQDTQILHLPIPHKDISCDLGESKGLLIAIVYKCGGGIRRVSLKTSKTWQGRSQKRVCSCYQCFQQTHTSSARLSAGRRAGEDRKPSLSLDTHHSWGLCYQIIKDHSRVQSSSLEGL